MSTGAYEAAPAPRAVIPSWSLADRLRKIRREVLDNISQEEFARRLGVKANAYSAWESGRARPRDLVPVAQRIELLSGVPAAWTLGLDVPADTPAEPLHSPALRRCNSAQKTAPHLRRQAPSVRHLSVVARAVATPSGGNNSAGRLNGDAVA